MARLDFKEISLAKQPGVDTDQFEKFSKLFFENVLGMEISSGPNRGADGGIDLCVEYPCDDGVERMLVSCKHYAHSGNSIGRADEHDIRDRLEEHKCDKFIGFYSTIISSSLESKLAGLNVKYKIYNSEDIEDILFRSVEGYALAKRFFPKSICNVLPQFISLINTFSKSDAVLKEGGWVVPKILETLGTSMFSSSAEGAVAYANELLMYDVHKPMFLSAWKDAVRLYPNYFMIPADGIESTTSIKDLPPKWSAVDLLDGLAPNLRWSLLAIWGLADLDKTNEILKDLGFAPGKKSTEVMSFEWLARSTGTNRRDILARLFAYHST